jgi:OOP family OmpA-OmpF porin
MRLVPAIIAAALLVATPAAHARDSGLYGGAGIGDFGIKTGGFDATDFSYKFFGGYDFIRYLGMEVEYIDGGSPSDHGLSIDFYGFNFTAVGRWPLTDQFDLIGKLGVIDWDARAHGFGSDSGTDFSYGVGAEYYFNDQFGLRGEYQGFDISNTDDVWVWSASVVIRF